MWIYEKRLQFPVKITKTCPKTAQLIISQYGGPDGELSASMMIVANWGRGTTIDMEGAIKTDKGYSDSGSAIYLSIGNNHGQIRPKRILENPDFIKEGLGEGQKSGLEYFLSKRYEVWKMQEDIDTAYYYKKMGYRDNSEREMMVRQYYPYIVKKYKYNENNILEDVQERCCDCKEMNEILSAAGSRASDDMKTCADKSCKECTRFYVDALISLCLGEELLDEFSIENGKSHRAVQALYQDSKDFEKKTKLKNLVDEIEKKDSQNALGSLMRIRIFILILIAMPRYMGEIINITWFWNVKDHGIGC